MILSREMILSTPDPVSTYEEVEIPEWGGTAIVRPMTGARRDRFEQAAIKDPGNNIRARLAAYSLCDEEGKFLFDDNDIKTLGEQPASALDKVFNVAMKVNALAPKDVDDLEKN